MSFWIEDLDIFFNSTDMTDEAILNDGSRIYGYLDRNPMISMGIDTAEITFLGKTSDLLGLVEGDEIIVDTVIYIVKRLILQDAGTTLLGLSLD